MHHSQRLLQHPPQAAQLFPLSVLSEFFCLDFCFVFSYAPPFLCTKKAADISAANVVPYYFYFI
jgi:hypothetical protein